MTNEQAQQFNEMLQRARDAEAKLLPEERRALRREQAISFVYGNLALSRLERGLPPPTHEEIAAAYDKIEGRKS